MSLFQNILCVMDSGQDCSTALERAVTLATNNQARLSVVEVMPRIAADLDMLKGTGISSELQSKLLNARMEALEGMVRPYREQLPIDTDVLIGTRFLQIIRRVLDNGHDLVIKLPEQQAWMDRFFSSDDMNLLRACPCPVWLSKPQADRSYRRILAAVDVDDAYPQAEQATRHALNQEIVRIAASLALSDFAELHVVNVWRAIGESTMHGALMNVQEDEIIAYVDQVRKHHQSRMNSLMEDFSRTLGQDAAEYLKPKIHLVKGLAHKEIPELAKQLQADVIVMGTVARTGVPGFIMGNTAETILNQIECSVLAIKPPGFETPVTLMT